MIDDPPVLPARPQHRRFRAYNVGLAKTGTRSVAGMFANYRALHEYLLPDTVRAVAERDSGAMSEDDFRAFIHWRDELTRLDMDSSSINCYYVDVLVREFPDARFVFAMRDCFSWLDSLLNMVVYGVQMVPENMLTDYMRKLLGPGFGPDLGDQPAKLQQELPGMMEAALRYWSTMNRFVLDNLPEDRCLILRTQEISRSLPALAALVGVPVETLVSSFDHLNQAKARYHLLHTVDPALLSGWSEQYCGDLMREFFPTVTLTGYLKDNPPRG
jgi:hypothetical protein